MRLLQQVDYFSHVCQMVHDEKKTWTFRINLCHTYNVSSVSKPTVFLACDPGSLHVQSVINKQRENKYEGIAILTISAITSKHTV